MKSFSKNRNSSSHHGVVKRGSLCASIPRTCKTPSYQTLAVLRVIETLDNLYSYVSKFRTGYCARRTLFCTANPPSWLIKSTTTHHSNMASSDPLAGRSIGSKYLLFLSCWMPLGSGAIPLTTVARYLARHSSALFLSASKCLSVHP
jgi:hypothetical protein